jgi:hypothetical protein
LSRILPHFRFNQRDKSVFMKDSPWY